MSNWDDKGSVEAAFVVLVASLAEGIQVIAGSDRDTIAKPIRVSVTAKPESIPNCPGFPCEVEILVVTPDTVSPSDRVALVRAIESGLRALEPERIYVDEGDVTIAGFSMDDTADASEGQMNGDLIRLRAGIVRGND